MQGAVIGTYRLVDKIGEGGMGAVWVAEHTLIGRRAAIKLLLPAFTTNEAIVQRFFNEARAVASISDPGIVQIFDFGVHGDGSAYIVMELLDGETLDARLRRLGRLSPLDAIRLVRQIAISLSAAHAKGVIHRDLKPENLFVVGDPAVTGGERPKVLDFGIAKLSGEDSKHKTRTGVMLGTPVYMSPEQCRGAASIDHRTDIYSLGAVLFCLAVGRPPFEGEGSGDVIIAHVRDQPPVPSAVAPGIPAVLDGVILRCLEKDPARRFQTMEELAAALWQAELAVRDEPVRVMAPVIPTIIPLAPGAPTAIAPARPPAITTMSSATGVQTAIAPPRRRRWAGLAISAAVAAALIVAGVIVVKGSGGGDDANPAAAAPVAPPAAEPAPVAPPPAAPIVTPIPEPAAPPPAPVAETPPTPTPEPTAKPTRRPKPTTPRPGGRDVPRVDRGD